MPCATVNVDKHTHELMFINGGDAVDYNDNGGNNCGGDNNNNESSS